MKGKIYIALLISCMTLMLAGCRAAQSTEADLVQENEITVEDTETADEKEQTAEKAQQLAEQKKRTTRKGPQSDTRQSEEQEEEQQQDDIVVGHKWKEIDDETVELLYGYYDQYNPLFGDENLELLQLSSYGDVRLDYAYIHNDCYEELSASLADCDSGTDDSENLYTGLCVRRADQELLSYVERRISDGAAAEYISHTFDVASGRELVLEDVVTDMDSLMKAVAKQAGKETAASDLEAWTVDYEGLTVYLRAVTEEAKPIYLSYEQYPDLLKERVHHIPSRYAVGFKQYNDLIADVDQDGKPDVIRMELVYVTPDANGNKADGSYIGGYDYVKDARLSEVVLKIGEYEISCPAYEAYDHDCGGYYIQNDDGQRYIYVYIKGELDSEYTYHIIRLDREGPVYVGEDAGDFNASRILTDPQRIKIKRECCWGTSGFHKWEFNGITQDRCFGYVDTEGYYTRDEDILYWYCGEIFYTTEEVEGIRVDVDGAVSEDTVTIAEGENVILLRIDFSGTYADYVRTDGNICRVETNYDWW